MSKVQKPILKGQIAAAKEALELHWVEARSAKSSRLRRRYRRWALWYVGMCRREGLL